LTAINATSRLAYLTARRFFFFFIAPRHCIARRHSRVICENGMQFRADDRSLADCGAHPLD
jgi:hypothetical protein